MPNTKRKNKKKVNKTRKNKSLWKTDEFGDIYMSSYIDLFVKKNIDLKNKPSDWEHNKKIQTSMHKEIIRRLILMFNKRKYIKKYENKFNKKSPTKKKLLKLSIKKTEKIYFSLLE